MRADARRLASLTLALLASFSVVGCDVVAPGPIPASGPSATSTVTEARAKEASVEIDGVAYTPYPGSRLVPLREGSGIGVRGGDAGASSGVVLTPAHDTVVPSQALRGVDLSADGVQFMVEISGVAAGDAATPEQRLVINLSLGWELGVLRVAGDYPSGCGQAAPGVGALEYAGCRGSIVVALREDSPVELARRADGVREVRIDRIDFDPIEGDLAMHLRETHRSGRTCEARLRFRPVNPCPDTTFEGLGLVLDDTQGNEAQVWQIAPRQDSFGDPIARSLQIGH